jgi:NADH-quinone oxidoreductase subunit L
LHKLLKNKYYFDELYQKIFADAGVRFGTSLWQRADAGFIDGVLVNGSAQLVNRVAGLVRRIQTGYLYHYAFAMIVGLIGIIAYWVIFKQG